MPPATKAIDAVIGANRGHSWSGAAIGVMAASGMPMVCTCDVMPSSTDSGSSLSRGSEVTDRKDYRTRIVTTANKANLELVEAQDLMFQKTAYAMAGFF